MGISLGKERFPFLFFFFSSSSHINSKQLLGTNSPSVLPRHRFSDREVYFNRSIASDKAPAAVQQTSMAEKPAVSALFKKKKKGKKKPNTLNTTYIPPSDDGEHV